MKHVATIVIGAGQAGLAASRCLSDRGLTHVVLERGEVANAWRRERWDSLRLLTPNWQSRLPGFAYSGPEPDGFMSMPEVVAYLDTYARVSGAPVEDRTAVRDVRAVGQGYEVSTDRGDWRCDTVVIATGACARPTVPALSAAMPDGIAQLTPFDYRNPDQLSEGGVLVVGASATGVQLASEIAASGRAVTLSAGEHIRMPRRYRGRDIQWWMDRAGLHATPAEEVDDLDRARRVPSLQLAGDARRVFRDLNALAAEGVRIAGRLAAVRDGTALFSGGLANHCALSDLKMNRLLAALDAFADAARIEGIGPVERFAPTAIPEAPLTLDLRREQIRTIVWATGFRPDFGFLDMAVFDAKGRLRHAGGLVAPGLYVLGLPFQRRRNSALIDGVGADAAFVADHIETTRGRRAA